MPTGTLPGSQAQEASPGRGGKCSESAGGGLSFQYIDPPSAGWQRGRTCLTEDGPVPPQIRAVLLFAPSWPAGAALAQGRRREGWVLLTVRSTDVGTPGPGLHTWYPFSIFNKPVHLVPKCGLLR